MASKHFPTVALPVSIVFLGHLLVGCGSTTKASLMESRLEGTPPMGTVRLPAQKKGVSFQMAGSLQINGKSKVAVGMPDQSEDIELTPSWSGSDSSRVAGGITLLQDQVVVSGEASVFLSPYIRVLVGADHNTSRWAGLGFCVGDPWTVEMGISGGATIVRRDEVWQIETKEFGSDKQVRDTSIVRTDTSGFGRFDITVTNRKGGILVGYQMLSFPITTAPNNGDEYDRQFHTITLGWQQPVGWGAAGAFVHGTWTGKAWSPGARFQYTLDLGGD
ncbi:MAG: hypothetical protein RL318_476 [Fibrobacterota bacterium]|jgi:hypothetical protein